MAPSNEYLLDESVQQQLAAHNNKLIKKNTVEFFGEEPEVHWDFNRAKEVELLGAYLGGFQEIDFRDGNVTVEEATLATYGTVDDYLKNRIASTHLNPASGFNKAQANGQVMVTTADGRIIREDRYTVAEAMVQEKADAYERAMTKKAITAAKPVNAAIRRGERIAPGRVQELGAIARGAAEHAAREQYRALGQGE